MHRLILASANLNIGKTHSERLLPLLQQLLTTADIKPESLDYLAVTVGPGSFTGLRIGISTAKALAFAWDKLLIPVLTLDALALNVRGYGKLACPILDARKNEVYAGLYAADGGRLMPPTAQPPLAVAERVRAEYPGQSVVLLGDGAELHYEIFRQVLAERVEPAAPNCRYFLAESAALWAAEHPGAALPAAEVKAFYLRLSEAEARKQAVQNAGA